MSNTSATPMLGVNTQPGGVACCDDGLCAAMGIVAWSAATTMHTNRTAGVAQRAAALALARAEEAGHHFPSPYGTTIMSPATRKTGAVDPLIASL